MIKVGDKVRVIGNTCSHNYYTGKILTITKVHLTFGGDETNRRIDVKDGACFVRVADITPSPTTAKDRQDNEEVLNELFKDL